MPSASKAKTAAGREDATIQPEHLLKLRLGVARYGEVDLAGWWNTKGTLGSVGSSSHHRRFPQTHLLDEGRANRKSDNFDASPKLTQKSPKRCIAVTLHLPEKIAHAQIDASAKRRKNRETNWSQQDIVTEALLKWQRSQ